MSESNLSANPDNTQEEVQLSPEEIKVAEEIRKDVESFCKPAHFVAALPNLLRGVVAEFTKATADPELSAASKTEDLKFREAKAAALIAKSGSEHAIFFSAKQKNAGLLKPDNFKPLLIPSMFGRAKWLLVEESVWKFLQTHGFVVRHHRSESDPTISDVHEIYLMEPGSSAAIEHASVTTCTRCEKKPAPIRCAACGAPYCTPTCRFDHKNDHDADCLASLVRSMSLTVEKKRVALNERVGRFEAEQEMFARRNRGKMVTVRRLGPDGTVISETQEIVIPAEETAASPQEAGVGGATPCSSPSDMN